MYQDTGNSSAVYVPRLEFDISISNIISGSDAYTTGYGPTLTGWWIYDIDVNYLEILPMMLNS